MYDPAVAMAVSGVSIRAWNPAVAGIREVFHARFADHAYPPHTHDTWTLFIVDDGAIQYDLDGRARGAEPAMVSVLPPHVVHDGRPATKQGFRKRVLYLETSLLGEQLIGSAVDRPAILDPDLRRSVSDLHDALECVDDGFEAETRLAFVVDRIRAAHGHPAPGSPMASSPRVARQLRAFLDAHATEQVTMAAAATELDASPTQLARGFASAFGIAPHAYVMGRRLDAARSRILDGQPLADVAADLGFCDQPHLTRRFKRFLGTTPAQFAGRARERSAEPHASGPFHRPTVRP